MISLKHQFLFIHVPKTGGNSIQNILKDYSEDDIVIMGEHQDGVERFEVRNANYQITKHATLAEYREVLDRATFEKLFKFATLRNPWDMMISFYFSPHRKVSAWDRDDFLSLLAETPTLRHYVHCPKVGEKLLGKMGLGAKGSLTQDIDFLIRFESIDEDFGKVCDRLEIPRVVLPKRNASSRAHYSSYYDEELVAKVADRFAEEIEWGGYQFERA
ncbi:hypothetical protein HNR46_002894 [Haloferula luteola]|uniref:Sulfotransferase family protein n=1 Tax=Haloferula luteola TaxID=595692 RepID=A0A840V6J1_9BACT|nr:sulfotransferase family 2 domain-containing protein [Haloferula luteola]MBB5352646.1 hypothetical protein [Haloferula luteola]